MKDDNRQPIAASLCAAAAILCLATAAPAQSATMGTLSTRDRAFMMKVSEGNIGEISAGKLAQTNAGSDAVRVLGKRYVDNHRANETQLSMLAARYGVTLPMHPTAMDRAEAQRLSMLHGRAFDTEFLRSEQQGHMMTIAMFKQEIATGSNPRVIAYAKTTLPVLDEHLMLATDDATHARMMNVGSTDAANPATGNAGAAVPLAGPNAYSGTHGSGTMNAGSNGTGNATTAVPVSPNANTSATMTSGSNGTGNATTAVPVAPDSSSGQTMSGKGSNGTGNASTGVPGAQHNPPPGNQ